MFRSLSRTGAVASFTLGELRPQWRYYRALFGQGFPAAMNMMTVTLGIFIITWFVGRFGQEAVAAYGIATRIEQIALLPVMGLNISTLALTAQNYGAGRIDRIRQVLAVSLRYGFMLALSGTAAALAFTGELMHFFTKDAAVVAVGVKFLRIEAFVFPAYVLLYICVSAMQGIKRPTFALWIGLYRQIAGPFLVFHILTTVLGWGIMGIWWGIFTVTWSAAVIVVVYVSWILKKLQKDVITA
jgi:Na+-driven multidrug efflux pump